LNKLTPIRRHLERSQVTSQSLFFCFVSSPIELHICRNPARDDLRRLSVSGQATLLLLRPRSTPRLWRAGDHVDLRRQRAQDDAWAAFTKLSVLAAAANAVDPVELPIYVVARTRRTTTSTSARYGAYLTDSSFSLRPIHLYLLWF
jgi:hypothetical protein